MLKQTEEAGNDILEGLGQEGVTQSERPFFICLNIISRYPHWSPHVLYKCSACSFYCLVHCTFHHGSSVVYKSSGPSSCLENEVQTFPGNSRPSIFHLLLFFQSSHFHTSLGGNSLPTQPMIPTRLRMKMLALPSTRPHTNPAHSAQFLVPC